MFPGLWGGGKLLGFLCVRVQKQKLRNKAKGRGGRESGSPAVVGGG